MTKQNKIVTGVIVVVIVVILVYFLWYKPRKDRQEAELDAPAGPTPVAHTAHTGSGVNFDSLPPGSFPIKKGDKSKLVYLLQKALNDLKGAKLSVDGNFGPATETALQSFYRVKSVDKELGQRIYTEYQIRAQQNSDYAKAADAIGAAMGI